MPRPFERLAIVNRGEAAMRAIHAARELALERGRALRTIAVYTDADRHALFVREADEAVSLGASTFVDAEAHRQKRYLDFEALESALRKTRAEAAWVGWGFVAARADGDDLAAFAPRRALLIGDAIRGADLRSNTLGRLLEEAWGGELFSTYGLTEAGLAFHECPAHCGLHSHPDFMIVEVLDDAGRAVPDGEAGELVIPSLQDEGTPLIRYRTGDVTSLVPGVCPCWRGGARIGPIVGRKAQRMKVKGTTIYTKVIEDALLSVAEHKRAPRATVGMGARIARQPGLWRALRGPIGS